MEEEWKDRNWVRYGVDGEEERKAVRIAGGRREETTQVWAAYGV